MLAARRRYGGARPPSGTMLDVLEEAEADYGRRASGLDAGAAAAAAAEVAPPDTPRKAAICEATRERIIQALFQALQANPRRVGWGGAGRGPCVPMGRSLARAKLVSAALLEQELQLPGAALLLSPAALLPCCRYGQEPSRDAMSHAQEVEDALFARCHTKQASGCGAAGCVEGCRLGLLPGARLVPDTPCRRVGVGTCRAQPISAACDWLASAGAHRWRSPCSTADPLAPFGRSTCRRWPTRCAWRAASPAGRTSRASPPASRASWPRVRWGGRVRGGAGADSSRLHTVAAWLALAVPCPQAGGACCA